MKLILLLAFVCGLVAVHASTCPYNHGNGRPGCKTANEMGRLWRNNWDPTRFWKCSASNKAAEMVLCQSGFAFQESEQKCVAWSCWIWTPPCNPPSLAEGC